MANKTVLFNKHLESNAKMVDFHGWDMPLNYGSQIEEHHAVRQDAGMFDVSHMTVVDVTGTDACAFLRKLLANDVGIKRFVALYEVTRNTFAHANQCVGNHALVVGIAQRGGRGALSHGR